MSDTTRAAKLLSEMKGGAPPQESQAAFSSTSKSLPPPPLGQGGLPFSIPFSPPAQQSPPPTLKPGTTSSPNNTALAPAGLKEKWIVVKEKCSSVLKTQGIAALVVFVIVAGIMAAVNPPIVQTKSKNPEDKPKRSVIKIMVWASLAAALAMVIPLGIEYAKNKKSKSVVANSSGV
jgi:hypothetical protein